MKFRIKADIEITGADGERFVVEINTSVEANSATEALEKIVQIIST